MKAFIGTLCLMLLFSCEKKQNDYIPLSEIEEFINESKHLNHKMDFPFGNRSVTFDKVIAFDHNYTGYYKDGKSSVLGEHVMLIEKQLLLNEKQIDDFIKFMSDKASIQQGYGICCYDNDFSLGFFNKNKLILTIKTSLEAEYIWFVENSSCVYGKGINEKGRTGVKRMFIQDFKFNYRSNCL